MADEGELQELTFARVDDLGFAAEGDVLPQQSSKPFVAARLGPLIEASLLGESGLLPELSSNAWIKPGWLAPLATGIAGSLAAWVCSSTGKTGYLKTGAVFDDDADTRWAAFGLKAQAAAQSAQFPRTLAVQFLGAIKELHSNIYEHSEASETGLVAFAAHSDAFEFVVADRGQGVLASLHTNPDYAGVSSHGEALRLALKSGVTRFKHEPMRGQGFDRMFTGLANLNGALRFRSGNAALTLDGRNAGAIRPAIRQKPRLDGFLISVHVETIRAVDFRIGDEK